MTPLAALICGPGPPAALAAATPPVASAAAVTPATATPARRAFLWCADVDIVPSVPHRGSRQPAHRLLRTTAWAGHVSVGSQFAATRAWPLTPLPGPGIRPARAPAAAAGPPRCWPARAPAGPHTVPSAPGRVPLGQHPGRAR